jgi:TRAP-type C4-dicarboxylate transport system substrate-binding protein
MNAVCVRPIAVLAMAFVVGCGAGGIEPPPGGGDTRADQNPLVLTIATGESNPVEADGFAKAVAEIANGAIEVRVDNTAVTGDGVPDYETQVIEYVADGKAELGFVAARAFDTVGVQSFAPLHAPFLIDSVELEAKVLASATAQGLLEGTRSAGMIGIGYVQGPLRRPLGYTRALLDLEDYAGARIGIRGSGLIEMTMEALGATPYVFPPGDTTGLDGMEVHVAQIGLGQYDFGADSLTGNVVFWPRPGVIFANTDAFGAFTAGQQAILREAAVRNLEASVTLYAEWERGNFEGPCSRGLQIKMAPDDAVARLRQAVQPVYDEIEKDETAKAAIEAIEALRASLHASIETVECQVAAATPLPSAALIDSPIVGTWTTSFTRDELAASPYVYDAGEINDGNWGDFTLTFKADGHVSFDLDKAIVSESTSGRYSLDGDHLVMVFDAGENRGETFGGRWSVFRDTLTFERTPPDVLPTTYLVRAWTRAP